MRITTGLTGIAALLALSATPAQATVISLFDYAFNIDGALTEASLGDPVPGNMNAAGFDFLTGLGNLSVTVSGAGDHNVLAFFDHEIDEAVNTFFNEVGLTGGALATGQTWEIDEPGFLFGDIYDNALANTLDNTNSIDNVELPDDVSMAIGFDFSLAATQTAVVTFFLDVVNNSSGAFFLRHVDPDSFIDQLAGPNELYFWATLAVRGDEEPPPPTGVPEPTTLALLAAGLLSFAARRRVAR